MKYLTFYLFFVSIVLLGNVDKIFLSGFPIRKVTFVIFFVFLILNVIVSKKISKSILYAFILFSIYFVIFSGVVPYVKGVNVIHSFAEVFPYLIPLLSLLIVNEYSDCQIIKLENFIKKVLFIFAFVHITTAFIYLVDENTSNFLYALSSFYFNDVNNMVNEPDMGNSFILPRVQFGMSVILLLGLYYSLIDYLELKKLKKLFLVIYFVVAVLVTQSRALVFSIIMLLPLFYLFKLIFSNTESSAFRVLTIFSVLFIPSIVTICIVHFDPVQYLGLLRSSGEDVRQLQLYSFVSSLNDDILFGYGLGNHSSVIRSFETPWVYELNILSVLFKIGIVGLLCLLALILYFLSLIIRKGSVVNGINSYSLLMSFLFAFVFASNTNPYLNNFVGGFFLMMVFTKICVLERNKE